MHQTQPGQGRVPGQTQALDVALSYTTSFRGSTLSLMLAGVFVFSIMRYCSWAGTLLGCWHLARLL
jgi:hypothetical protein